MEKNHSSKTEKVRFFKKILAASIDSSRPLLAQMVVTRRCNLTCGYCYEYDKVSKPVPFQILKERIDHLKKLKVVFITLNGGEPLLHPQIVDLVRYIHSLGIIPLMNSNGRILTRQLIEDLGNAGLYGIQISCDTMEDNEITSKSMKRLLPKLELLKIYATFRVRINSVLGSSPPQEVLSVAKIVVEFGFDFQCSIIRDDKGGAQNISEEAKEVYMQIRKLKSRLPMVLNDRFQLPLINGEEIKWKCRAGARHFEIDAAGLVHLCQPRTGEPSKPLLDYTKEDILFYFNQEKTCSKRCPIAYAHLASRMDKFRTQ